MGSIRNGARTFLNILHKACKLSKLPGFKPGLIGILGPEDGLVLFQAWDVVCVVVDGLVTADNFYNQIDTVAQMTGDEDGPEAP